MTAAGHGDIITVYENGSIFDLDVRHPRDTVLITAGERILAVGPADQLASIIDRADHRVDLQGRALYPGFIDAHAHFIDTGLMARRADLGNCKSINDVLELIRASAEMSRSGWVFGGNLDENFLAEMRLPSRAELDEAANGLPVYINHRSYHWTLVNTEALRYLDLDPSTPGYTIGDDAEPTGMLNLEANAQAKIAVARLVPNEDIDDAIAAAGQQAAEGGMTTVHCVEGGAEYGGARFVDRLLAFESLPFEPVVYFNTENASEARERGLSRVGGDLTVDGSISNWTAAFTADYEDREGESGHLYYSRAELEEMIEDAHSHGMQISFHAIGDRGVKEIVAAFAEVLPRHPARDHRHRIEHFGLPDEDTIVTVRALGLVITVQPAFMLDKLPTYEQRLGARSQRLYPLRTLVEAGMVVAGSSDTMVSRFNALYGIHAAVNHPIDTERLDVTEAVRLYTTHAARAAFRENEIGALRPGMRADMTVLERDLRDVPKENIRDTRVTLTVFRGRVVYEAK